MQGLQQVRPVDPVYTRIAVDFNSAEEGMAIPKIFKPVVTPGDSVTLYKGDADNSLRDESPAWARNAEATKVDIRWGSDAYTVVPRAYKTLLTASDRRNFLTDLDLGTFAIRKLVDKMKIASEVAGEALIRGSANINSTAAGTNWATAGLDPVKNFNTLNALTMKATGKRLTDVVIPPGLWDARFATVGANTAGLLMRTQLGYLALATAQNMDPNMAAKWLGADRGYVPYAPKAGGSETSPAKDGLGSGAYIWSDTTVCYAFVVDQNPAQGVTTYGLSLGPWGVQADVPNDSWDPPGVWYRVSMAQNEFEVTAKCGGKITGC